MIEEGRDIEIVFVSSDQDESSYDEYFGTMPWVGVPLSNKTVKQTLSSRFGVRGIPMLVVLKGSTGEVMDMNGRNTVVDAKGNTDIAWSKWA